MARVIGDAGPLIALAKVDSLFVPGDLFTSRFSDEGAELSDHNGVCIEVDEIAER